MSRVGDGFKRALEISAYIPIISTVVSGGKAIIGGLVAGIQKGSLIYHEYMFNKCTDPSEKSKYKFKILHERVLITTCLKGMKEGAIEAIPIIGNIYAGVRDYKRSQHGRHSPSFEGRAHIPRSKDTRWKDTDT